MDQAYIDKNTAHCEKRIESLELRLKSAEVTGEDVDWLESELDGYKATLKNLSKSDSD